MRDLRHRWETSERTFGRLVLLGVDRERLRSCGLTLGWAGTDHYGEPGGLCVSLDYRDHSDGWYQVFVLIEIADRTPEAVAEACRPDPR